jgi:hypothetical protein
MKFATFRSTDGQLRYPFSGGDPREMKKYARELQHAVQLWMWELFELDLERRDAGSLEVDVLDFWDWCQRECKRNKQFKVLDDFIHDCMIAELLEQAIRFNDDELYESSFRYLLAFFNSVGNSCYSKLTAGMLENMCTGTLFWRTFVRTYCIGVKVCVRVTAMFSVWAFLL